MFTDYAEWLRACQQRPDLKGPYAISGQDYLTQFVGADGTAALWNDNKNRGEIFPGSTGNAK